MKSNLKTVVYGKLIFRRILMAQLLASACLITADSAFAETVAEWKFDAPASNDGIVQLDEVRKGSSDKSRLSETAKISEEKTGISDKWSPFLATGFLEAKPGGSLPQTGIPENLRNKYGLYTIPGEQSPKSGFYKSYFGFSGFGQMNDGSHLKGGTIYLILSPMNDFKKGMQYGFMGTGNTNEGRIWVEVGPDEKLQLILGDSEALYVTIDRKLKPRKWYFIAASWRVQEKPILYVREMDPNGPSVSPKADVKSGDIELPDLKGPSSDPLVIGSSYYNPGAGASTVYGADARIAYACFDNTFSDEKKFDEVFLSLGVR